MKKILIINSNTSLAATKHIERGLAPYVKDGFEVTFVNAAAGPEGIDTLLDIGISALETARIIAANRGEFDAYIVACGADPGLDMCRQIVDEPVVGLAESAMLLACPLGYKFSIMTTLEAEIPIVQQLVNHYGLSARLASVRAIDMTTAELADRKTLFDLMVAGARQAVKDDRAEVIILAGSVMLGLEDKLSDAVQVPVLTGMVSALKMAEALVDYGQKTSRAYKYSTPDKHDKLTGYDDFQDVYSA